MTPFKPTYPTIALAVNASSASATVPAGSSQIRLYNGGLIDCFVRFSSAADTASTATDMPLAAGAIELFTKGAAKVISAVTVSGSTTLYMTMGEGE